LLTTFLLCERQVMLKPVLYLSYFFIGGEAFCIDDFSFSLTILRTFFERKGLSQKATN
jgi:hypothetical protein